MLFPRFAMTWIVLRSICRTIHPPRHSTGFYDSHGHLYHFYPGIPLLTVHFCGSPAFVVTPSAPPHHPLAQQIGYNWLLIRVSN